MSQPFRIENGSSWHLRTSNFRTALPTFLGGCS